LFGSGDLFNLIDGLQDHDQALLQPTTSNSNSNVITLDQALNLFDLDGQPCQESAASFTTLENANANWLNESPAQANHLAQPQLPLTNFDGNIISDPFQAEGDILQLALQNINNIDSSSDDSSSSTQDFSVAIQLPSTLSGNKASKRSLTEETKTEQDAKKIRLSESERCKKYREKQKEDKKAEENELEHLERVNYCLKDKLGEMEEKMIKFRKIRDLIVFQAGAGLALTPEQHQAINDKVQEALFDINFGF